MEISTSIQHLVADLCQLDPLNINNGLMRKCVTELGRHDWVIVSSKLLSTLQCSAGKTEYELQLCETAKYDRMTREFVLAIGDLDELFRVEDDIIYVSINGDVATKVSQLIRHYRPGRPID